MAQGPHTGLLDLEKELTCSVSFAEQYWALTHTSYAVKVKLDIC